MSEALLFVQDDGALPEHDDWLSSAELERLGAMRFPKRRGDYRLGRWTAKQAVADYLGHDSSIEALGGIVIGSDEEGAPEAWVAGDRAPCSISLSHREGRALCAVAAPEARVGCDIERVERRSSAFVDQFLSDSEAASVESAPEPYRSRAATLFWSAKESALKALRTGLSVDTRDVVVELSGRPAPRTWLPLEVSVPGEEQALAGWWMQDAGWLLPMVSRPAAVPSLRAEAIFGPRFGPRSGPRSGP